jgi:hypothetical protein
MHGFHASDAPCSYGWVLHLVSLGLAGVIALFAAMLAWWG